MITVVSGLPRSGTSLMMQMLHAGGLSILTDNERKPDADNPKGYFEWERIKQLPRDPDLIAEAEGKVVKVISQLLSSLPPTREYHIIFMRRPLLEILKSQDEMLRRRGNPDQIGDTSVLEEAFPRHLVEVNRWITNQSNMKLARVHYHRLLREPEKVVKEVADFLSVPLNLEAMIQQIDQSLYRNRTQEIKN